MKNIIITVTALLLVISTSAQKTFFPLKSGTKLTYQTYDKKDKVTGTIRYTIKDVKIDGDNLEVRYQIESLDDKDKMLFADEVSFRQIGDTLYFDMGNLLNKAAFQQDGQIPPTIEITGNNLQIPLHPVPGMTLPDATVTMSMKMGIINMKMSANVTNRKVESEEDVVVKGGTFKAFKITSDVSSSILGMKINSKGADWYAYGVGIVRNESFNKKGEMQSSMELIEIVE